MPTWARAASSPTDTDDAATLWFGQTVPMQFFEAAEALRWNALIAAIGQTFSDPNPTALSGQATVTSASRSTSMSMSMSMES